MKRWIVVVMVVALAAMLAGCASGKVDAQKIAEAQLDNRMFMVVSEESDGQVLVDKSTGVMYWVSYNTYNYGNLTLLVNPDGTPRIWEG